MTNSRTSTQPTTSTSGDRTEANGHARASHAPHGAQGDAADIIAAITRRLAEKRAPSSVSRHANAGTSLRDAGLTSGPTDVAVAQWLELYRSTEHLWDAAAQLWRGGFSAPAAAFAIVSLQETAKLAAEGLRVATARPASTPRRNRHRVQPDAPDEQLHVVVHAALANGRINRYLGAVQVNEFLEVLEDGKLDGIRHSCLHAEPGVGGPSVPRDAVTRERAAWLVALAGEVLADIQFEPGEWGRVLTKVDAFEQAAGIQEPTDEHGGDHARWTAEPPPAENIQWEATA
jgi:AbiV family abortive infection protein